MGTIAFIVPESGKYISYGRYIKLFELVMQKFNSKLVITKDYKSVPDADIIVIFKSPEYYDPSRLEGIHNLLRNKILIGYWTDIHFQETITSGKFTQDEVYKDKMRQVLDRCDYILCPYKYTFQQLWGEYMNKFVFFPHFINYMSNGINTNPAKSCLLSGMIDDAYPLRKEICSTINDNIFVLKHPGYGMNDLQLKTNGFVVDKEYYQTISKFLCSIATCGLMNYVTGKYFEIPSMGTLLLANHTPDLDTLGFQDNVNFVEINKYNWTDKIDYIVSNPEQYTDIRMRGYNFVVNNHTIYHRANQLIGIIDEATRRI